jgi:hypothetical protein
MISDQAATSRAAGIDIFMTTSAAKGLCRSSWVANRTTERPNLRLKRVDWMRKRHDAETRNAWPPRRSNLDGSFDRFRRPRARV